MLNVRNLSFRVGGDELFHDVSFEVYRGQRIGLVGRNGSGKSTLLRIIHERLEPEEGRLEFAGTVSVVAVAQETPDTDASVLAFTLDGDSELRALEERLASGVHDERYFAAQARYEAIGGFGAAARASQLLAGLGFSQEDLGRPVRVLSGGWRMRINLARALMARADLLLLDEPTNHLDLEAIAWLEQYLARFDGALLVVSHDRDFLNAVVNRVAAIHDHTLSLYVGSYDAHIERRALEVAQREAAESKQAAQVEALERFVARFRAKASKARQAQSRLKMLERMERVTRLRGEVSYTLPLKGPERVPDTLITLRDVAFGYPDAAALFAGVGITVAPGDRIGVIGRNGAGKSTFLKVLLGALAPTAGTRTATAGITVGYFAQHQLEQLNPQGTPLSYMAALDPAAPLQALRDFLGGFGFGSAGLERAIQGLSGGEKSRLVLAGLSWGRPHLLLLDEPTNHLDLEMREALGYALQDYSGALILVSHDRHLIRSCADTLWLVGDRGVREYAGDLEDYQRETVASRAPKAAVRPTREPRRSTISPKTYRREQQAIEARMAADAARLAEIDAVLGDPRAYQQGGETIKILQAERAVVTARQAADEEEWLALEEKLAEVSARLL